MKLSFEEVELHVCDTKDEEHLWPAVTGDEYEDGIDYCPPCGAAMTAVAEALGFKLHSIELPKPPQPLPARRAIALQGVPR